MSYDLGEKKMIRRLMNVGEVIIVWGTKWARKGDPLSLICPAHFRRITRLIEFQSHK